MLRRWLLRIAMALIVAFIALYTGDWIVFALRGSPVDKVTVNRYLAVPLKGNKQEFDFLGTVEVPCAVALIAQNRQGPCWQVRRTANQGIKM